MARKIVTMSAGLTGNRTLAGLLGQVPTSFRKTNVEDADLVVGWGYRPSGKRALAASGKVGQVALLEDGFLRSVGRRDPALSINFDREGMYYDAASPSLLFDQIKRSLSPAQTDRARALMQAWRDAALSKYNDGKEYRGVLPDRFALVIDQVRNDHSISSGMADEKSFAAMLEAALASDPTRDVVVKIHPDSLRDPSKRHFDIDALEGRDRLHFIAEPVHIASLIAQAEEVFTVTSQVGFEALLHGKPVRVFGMPFYAGWGLTQDQLPRPEGRSDVPLEQLVHAALVDYPRYWNPVRAAEAEAEDAIALVALNRRLRSALPRTIYAHGFSRWKRPFIAQFLSGSDVRFVKKMRDVPKGATLLLWGRRNVPEGRDDCSILRIEDGFLRSSGLGADLVRPLSLVIDDLGIYYDSSAPSRLERILEESAYDETEKSRAAALRNAIVDQRLSKYNLGGSGWQRPADANRVLLVVGQVEDDASIQYGSPETRTNIGLLRRVRTENPDAYIVYKPHPDVVAGLRKREQERSAIAGLCDAMVTDTDPVAMLDQVDEVHTMTSLMGFEALLRGLPVTCYGLPFYAGWGLTSDKLDCDRRTRTLSLDEVVHGALIDYPRYWSVRGNIFAPPEDILVELKQLAEAGPATRSLLRKALRPILGTWKKFFG